MNPSIFYMSGLAEPANPPTAPVEILMADSRVWDQRNLNVITYRDGYPIPEVTDAAIFAALTTGAWCHYSNMTSRGLVYGRMYNWYAMMGIWQTESVPPTPAQIADRKQIAPIGWSVPSENEWLTLRTVLGESTIAGKKLKESGTSHWIPTNTGDNSSFFTALPGGYRGTINFNQLGTNGYWLVKDTTTPTTFTMTSTSNNLTRSISSLWTKRGSSIRLIKDSGGITGFTTKFPTIIGPNSLLGTGGIIPTDYPESPTGRGIVYGLTSNPTIFSPNVQITSGSGLGEYTINITTGIASSTRYYIRAYAIFTSTGISYAPQVIVDTLSATPQVATNDVTEISTTTATCGGYVQASGGLTLIERGVCWNTTGTPTTANSRATSTFAGGDGLGSFIIDITGLTAGVTYYARAYARNSSATGYGEQKQFTTLTVPSINLIFNQYPAHHAYSLRGLSNTYNYKCLRVRRATTFPSATTTFVNVLFNSSGEIGLDSEINYVSGYPTEAITLGEFAASVDNGYDNVDGVNENQNIFISIWYDQSGNVVNIINNSINAQPKIVTGGDLEFGVKCSGAQTLSVTNSSVPYNNESVYVVGSASATTAMNFYTQGYGNTNSRMFIGRQGGIWYNNNAGATQIDFPVPQFVPNVTRLYELICGPSTTSAFTNGVQLSPASVPSMTVTNAVVRIGANSNPAIYANGLVNEAIAFTGVTGTTDRNIIETNINTYYSIWI